MGYTINHVVLVGGNITKDAELRFTNNGSAVCSFNIALNRKFKQGEEWVEAVDFFKVTYWGKPAEAIGKFLLKGKKVAVEGRLSQSRWENESGKHSSVEVVASNVVLLGAPQGERAEDEQREPEEQPYREPEYKPMDYKLPPPYNAASHAPDYPEYKDGR